MKKKLKEKLRSLLDQLKDKTNIVIFCICYVVLSSEVWVPYLIYFITGSKWWLGIGSACWAFWLAPFTPFIPLCIACTFGARKIYDKVKIKKMILKPKISFGNEQALVYRRYTDIVAANTMKTVYKTEWTNGTNAYWIFDKDKLEFVRIETEVPTDSAIVSVTTGTTVLSYVYSAGTPTPTKQTKYWKFLSFAWQETQGGNNPILAQFGTVAKYQLNKYYFVGAVDYTMKGSIEGATTQYIKGSIMPLSSMNIRYFADDPVIRPDDLVVIDSRLYSVENVSEDHKHLPRDYKIRFATLNSVL